MRWKAGGRFGRMDGFWKNRASKKQVFGMLRFPGDPEAPASDVINCHCRLSPHVLLERESIDENRDCVTERDLRNSGEKGKINYDKAVFSGQRTLLEHWEKHKAEFTEIKTKKAYLETARWQLRQLLKKEFSKKFIVLTAA